ncbi:hypothetical protein DPMN_039016 [Dreissena polymorpha]|uniref:Uncharacterized protein n=1 Tax=Dreissena polymorpha TaxID=45954 RepID=A0A9D4MGK6_DREPO|nr:hypothetical protein DPMN_039016 [Dreissena polymorpha]
MRGFNIEEGLVSSKNSMEKQAAQYFSFDRSRTSSGYKLTSIIEMCFSFVL